MKKHSKIIFDFDRTLFDDDKFISDFIQIFKSHGVTDEALLQAYSSLKIEKALWSPYRWIERALGQIPERIMQSIDGHLTRTSEYVYADVARSLDLLRTSLSILSYGDEEIQRKKILHSDLIHYFDTVVITQDDKKTSAFLKYTPNDNIVFVDDRGPIIDAVKSAHPTVTCIRIMRPGSAYNHEPSLYADQVISSLDDLKVEH